jgi:hypothetical protein
MDFSSLTRGIRRAREALQEEKNKDQSYTSLLNEAKALVHALEQLPAIATKIAIDQVSGFCFTRSQ